MQMLIRTSPSDLNRVDVEPQYYSPCAGVTFALMKRMNHQVWQYIFICATEDSTTYNLQPFVLLQSDIAV
jgi:hypothetical protein